MDAPVKSEHLVDCLPVGQRRFGDLNDEVKHDDSTSIWTDMFAEGRSQAPALLEAILHDLWQSEQCWGLAPLPRAFFVRKTKEQRGSPSLKIERETVALAELRTVVSCIGQYTDFEQWHGLKLFIGSGQCAGFEKGAAALLHHVLQRDTCGLIVLKRFLQGWDGFFDDVAVLSRQPFFRFWTANPLHY